MSVLCNPRVLRPDVASCTLRAPFASCCRTTTARQSQSRPEVVTRAYEQAVGSRISSDPERRAVSSDAPGRHIVFAVDGTEDGQQACSWLVDNFCRAGTRLGVIDAFCMSLAATPLRNSHHACSRDQDIWCESSRVRSTRSTAQS